MDVAQSSWHHVPLRAEIEFLRLFHLMHGAQMGRNGFAAYDLRAQRTLKVLHWDGYVRGGGLM